MNKFIAFLIVLIILVVGKPVHLHAQTTDSVRPIGTPVDTQNMFAPVRDTSTRTVAQPAPVSYYPRPVKKHDASDKKKKEHKSLLYRIHMIGYKKREKRRYIEHGHHEFYLRSKHEQKRISRHHLNPYKPTKSDKKMVAKIKKDLEKAKDKKQEAKEATTQAAPEPQKPADATPQPIPEPAKPIIDTLKPKEPEAPKADTVKQKM